jgi:hypothetical protein
MFRDRPDVFVAGDLFWYPIEGDNNVWGGLAMSLWWCGGTV